MTAETAHSPDSGNPNAEKTQRSWVLWLCVVLAFVILISAWTTIILIGVHHAPKQIEVPANEE